MTKKLMVFKAEVDDAERWRKALSSDGRTLSAVCRAALDRLADRIEKKQGQGEPK